MTKTHSSSSSLGEGEGFCPRSGTEGRAVGWRTVAALVRGPLPRRQRFWLCRDPGCAIVYFGSEGALTEVAELQVEPGFKDLGGGLLCYCFGYRRSDIEGEIRETGTTSIPQAIQVEIAAGSCACEVRNPTGKCCLRELRQFADTVSTPARVSGPAA